MRHRYGPHFHHFGDLHLPLMEGAPLAGRLPVAVLLHGGFWREQFTLDITDDLARDLARRGWAAWNAEYRRVGEVSGGGDPQTVEDVGAAVDALATIDAPLDLDRVVVIGHSAGGMLALWAAGRRDGAVRVAGAVSLAGVTDLREADVRAIGDGAVAELMGARAGEAPERYAAASPIERVPLGLPQLLVHGDADDRVPVDLSERYAEAARAAGDDVELVVLPGEDHFVHLDPSGRAWETVVRWLRRFEMTPGRR
jgi:dipeptidyl aminopeptidase/acylaminoacyl peptidase